LFGSGGPGSSQAESAAAGRTGGCQEAEEQLR
jgi:hypothetical protein